jgi:hypothetical protein
MWGLISKKKNIKEAKSFIYNYHVEKSEFELREFCWSCVALNTNYTCSQKKNSETNTGDKFFMWKW